MTDPAAGAGGPACQISVIVAGQGGVLTADAGLLHGPLTATTQLVAGRLRMRVQSTDDGVWHEVAGSPLPVSEPADGSGRAALALHLRLHQAVIRLASVAGLPDGLSPQALQQVDLGGDPT
ncbi:hypothetical protein ACFOWE_11805 [Planomonospora corallina]|uniref:Uncharacterized protein n=1 Tax=Planomonospora corallina TaxID=1806052 RepID=A0ABV8I482_9ACTN